MVQNYGSGWISPNQSSFLFWSKTVLQTRAVLFFGNPSDRVILFQSFSNCIVMNFNKLTLVVVIFGLRIQTQHTGSSFTVIYSLIAWTQPGTLSEWRDVVKVSLVRSCNFCELFQWPYLSPGGVTDSQAEIQSSWMRNSDEWAGRWVNGKHRNRQRLAVAPLATSMVFSTVQLLYIRRLVR